MRSLPLILAAPLLAAPALAQDGTTRAYPDGVAAIVEGDPITRHELELACRLRSDYRSLASGPRQRSILAAELEEIIKQRVLLRKTREQDIEFTSSDEARLKWELSRRARDRRGVEGLKADLETIGVPFDYFVERQKANILIGKLLVKTISRDIFITPEELRRFYEQHPERFARPGRLRFRQIVLFPDPERAYRGQPPGLEGRVLDAEGQLKPDWDPAAVAAELRQQVLDGADFRALAEQTSMGVNFAEDEVYETDTRLSDVLVPPLDELVTQLPVGKVSDVITSERDSVHLVWVVAREASGRLPLEEVQSEIEAELKEAVWRRRLDAWIARVRQEAHVQVFLPPDPR